MKIIKMMLIKNIFLSALFASVSCYELKYFNLSPKTPPITHTNMAQLFELCFANTSNPIVITENLVDTLYKDLSFTTKAPVVIINKDFVGKDIQQYYPTYPMYIVSFSSHIEVYEFLLKLAFSPSNIWSQKSIFFVIFETENSCERSWEILRELWGGQLLSCVVVCSRTGNETSLYTYNPFTKGAPDSWVDINMYFIDKHNRPVALYNQTFTNDYKICETLFFNKTKILDGYPVKIASVGQKFYIELSVVFSSLNITQQNTYFEIANVSDAEVALFKNVYDFLAFYTTYHNPRVMHTLPLVFEISFIIVTQKANFLSTSYQIDNVLDINGAIAIILLLFIITILIILHNKYQIGLAVLDVLKLLMNMGIDAPLDRLAMKITFFTGFFFVFFFSPALIGQLFAVLTRPPTYNIESLKDLYDHKYHVYYPVGIHKNILEEQLWKSEEDMKYLHSTDPFYGPEECRKEVIVNNTVACIFQDFTLIDYAVKHNLHVSKRFMLKIPTFHHTQRFWALADRFYLEALKLFESGYYDNLFNVLMKKPLAKKKVKDRIQKINDYLTVDAVDLTYLCVFMAFFQFLAIIVFGIEYIVGRHRRPIQ